MKFSTNELYNAVVISFTGKLMGGPEAVDFHNKIEDYLKSGKKNVILEMTNVKPRIVNRAKILMAAIRKKEC